MPYVLLFKSYYFFSIDLNDCMKKFFSFLQIKNKMEALHDDSTIFWAFETSSAIKVSEQKTISR